VDRQALDETGNGMERRNYGAYEMMGGSTTSEVISER
jgi:hypothetical protein